MRIGERLIFCRTLARVPITYYKNYTPLGLDCKVGYATIKRIAWSGELLLMQILKARASSPWERTERVQ